MPNWTVLNLKLFLNFFFIFINVSEHFKQVIMKDKWMNLGCEEDELKPYVEPEQDFKEPKRIGVFLLLITNSK